MTSLNSPEKKGYSHSLPETEGRPTPNLLMAAMMTMNKWTVGIPPTLKFNHCPWATSWVSDSWVLLRPPPSPLPSSHVTLVRKSDLLAGQCVTNYAVRPILSHLVPLHRGHLPETISWLLCYFIKYLIQPPIRENFTHCFHKALSLKAGLTFSEAHNTKCHAWWRVCILNYI